MPVAPEELPAGRYGRSADARADRRLKTVGAVLGAVALLVIGWFGFRSLAGSNVSGEIIAFKRVSPTVVEVHLEVRKSKGTRGMCTLRALDVYHTEVGRKDVHFGPSVTRTDEVVTLRTTSGATGTELLGCSKGG